MLPAPRPRLSSANEQLFVVLMHLFPKKMQLVAKLMNLDVGTLLLHYYSTFKRSMEYRRSRRGNRDVEGRLTRRTLALDEAPHHERRGSWLARHARRSF